MMTVLRGILHPGVRGSESNDALVNMGAIGFSIVREIALQYDQKGAKSTALIMLFNTILFSLIEANKAPSHLYSQILSGVIFRTILDMGSLKEMSLNYQPQFFTTLTAYLLFNISRTLRP
jgi:ABC-type enterochelin transport system permease subunit